MTLKQVTRINDEWPTPTHVIEEYGGGRFLLSNNYNRKGDVLQIEGKQYAVAGDVLPYHNNYTGRYGFIYTLEEIVKP